MACRSLRHLLAAVLMLLFLATGAVAAVQVRVVPTTGAVGSTVTVAVEADSVTDLGGFQFAFSFNTADLQVLSAAINSSFDKVVLQDLGGSTGNGMIAASAFDNLPVTGSPVALATIDFKVLTPVTSGIHLSKTILGKIGGAEIPATFIDGDVVGTSIYIPPTDVTPPTDGTMTATLSTGQVYVSWTAATDPGGIIASYTLRYGSGGFPPDCSSGLLLYNGPLTSYVDIAPGFGTSSYYRVCATDGAGNTSTGATASTSTALPAFTLTFLPGSNGTIGGSTTQSVNQNGSATPVTAYPAAGYHFVNWTGTNGFVAATANPLTVSNVTASMAIAANFANSAPTATANSVTVAENGTIAITLTGTDPELSSLSYAAGMPSHGTLSGIAQNLTYTPVVGYVGADSFTFTVSDGTNSSVQAMVSITVSQVTQTVTFIAGTNGTLSGTGSQMVNYGGTTTAVTAIPAAGYHFVNWTGTTGFAATVNPLIISNITADMAITANFAQDADTTLPTVRYFMIPGTATSLTVTVDMLVADDNIGVTGYLLSELSTQPSLGDLKWSPTPPTSYVFATQGARTLYAFARDAAGNISGGYPATVLITLPDTTPPVVETFTLPATAQSLAVPVTSLTATDDTAVTGYLLSEAPTQPLLTDSAWSPSSPSAYTCSSPGARDLYAFAKDASGNVSAAFHASVSITLPDATPPAITSFTMPATASSLTVAVSSVTAVDDVAVTGYLLSEKATQPLLSDPAWTPVPAVSYTFSTQGNKTLYSFARDAAGNVSAAYPAHVTIILPDLTPPMITSLSLPATSTSLTVMILGFSAYDDVSLTGYLLSERSTPPLPADPHWTPTPWGSYTFTNSGRKTLYAFAEDAAGNISLPATAEVTITLPDIQPPLIESFSLPATASGLTVAVITFTASDDVGIAAFLLSENAGKPSLADPAWTPTASGSYTFAAPGAKTLYAFARDAAGNISQPVAAMVTISLPDTTSPTILSFGIPATASTLTVPVTAFTAVDDNGVAGYLLTESSAAPLPTDSRWTPTPSGSYTFATAGTKTLYAFAKDAAGSISEAVPATVIITIASANYIITATAGADGSIEPAGEVLVNSGLSRTFTFSPAAGYHIADVIVDGTSVGPVPTYTFPNVLASHTIHVKFAPPDGILDPNNTSGSITITDAVIVLGIVMGDIAPTPAMLIHGDVAPLINGKPSPDGKIDLGDVVVILRRLVGLL